MPQRGVDTDPEGFAISGRGFVVESTGKPVSEPYMLAVPVNPNEGPTFNLALLNPGSVIVRAAEVGGIPTAGIGPHAGRMLYLVVDAPKIAWHPDHVPACLADKPPLHVSTWVIKMGVTIEDGNYEVFPPRGGVRWVHAQQIHPIYGPPWGYNQLKNDLDLCHYNGMMFFASYDGVTDHPDPNQRAFADRPPGTDNPVRKAGGIYVDWLGDFNETRAERLPATMTTTMRYGRWSSYQNSQAFVSNTMVVWQDRLFAATSYYPGMNRVNYALPGLAHKFWGDVPGDFGGWPVNDFFDVARWQGWSIVGMVSTPEALYIFTDSAGTWAVYGGAGPAEWRLVNIGEETLVGQRSLTTVPETMDVVFLDSQNRLWAGRPGQFKHVDRALDAARDIAAARGGPTPAVETIGEYVLKAGSPSTARRPWRRLPLGDVYRQYNREGGLHPFWQNMTNQAITRSRYTFGMDNRGTNTPHWPFDHLQGMNHDLAYDPSEQRLYIAGSARRNSNKEHPLWYTDWTLIPFGYRKIRPGGGPEGVHREQPDEVDWLVFSEWYFGTEFDLKRVHSVFVTSQPSHTFADLGEVFNIPATRWYIRYRRATGAWSSPGEEDTKTGVPMSAAPHNWIPMRLADWTMDAEGWNRDAAQFVPADGQPHRLTLIDDVPGNIRGDYGRGVLAIQLAVEFAAPLDPPAVGVRIHEIAVEYEVLRQWP